MRELMAGSFKLWKFSPLLLFMITQLFMEWMSNIELISVTMSKAVFIVFLWILILPKFTARALSGAASRLALSGLMLITTYIAVEAISQIPHIGNTINIHIIVLIPFVYLLLTIDSWQDLFDDCLRFVHFFLAFLLIFPVLLGPSKFLVVNNRLFLLIHPNYLGCISAFLLAVVICHPSVGTVRRVILSALLSALILLSRSRTGLIMSLVLLFAAILRPWKDMKINVALVLTLALVALTALPFSEDITDYILRGEDKKTLNTLTDRTKIWQVFMDKIKDNLWTGLGSEGIVLRYWLFGYGRFAKATGFSAHNLLLQIAATKGIIMTVVTAVVFTFAFLKSAWNLLMEKNCTEERKRWNCYACCVLAIGLINSITEVALFNIADLVTFFFWPALIASLMRREVTQLPGRIYGSSEGESNGPPLPP